MLTCQTTVIHTAAAPEIFHCPEVSSSVTPHITRLFNGWISEKLGDMLDSYQNRVKWSQNFTGTLGFYIIDRMVQNTRVAGSRGRPNRAI